MKRVTKFETLDGKLFDSERDAKRHAEKRYGDALLSLGRRLTHQSYTFVTDFIDENLEAFIQLKALKQDYDLIENEEDT